jgi:hypothetical protein
MPAALDVDWEAVRVLAVAVGLAEASIQTGISYGAIRQRSCREGWLTNIPRSQPLPPTLRQPVADVTSPHVALANSMRQLAVRGRLAALQASAKGLEALAGKDADELLLPEVAGVLDTHGKVHARAAGYGAADSVTRLDLRLTGAPSLPPSAVVEAEWSDSPSDLSELPGPEDFPGDLG